MPPEPTPTAGASGPTPARPRAPLGLLGMLALVVLVESLIMRHDVDTTTLIASNWEFEGSAPARFGPASKILCFGDSMVKFGVQPRVLGATLGKPTYNFALYCGAPQASYYLLKRALDAGSKPEAIVVDYQPEFLMGDQIDLLSRAFPELLTVPEAIDLYWHVALTGAGEPTDTKLKPGGAGRLAEYLVAHLLPSARKRYEIRANVLANVAGKDASIRDNLLARKRNWKINRGAEALPRNPLYRGEVPEVGGYPAMFWTPWKVRPLNAEYLDRFVGLAASRDIPVFWVIQPNARAVDRRRQQVGYNDQYEAYVRSRLDRFPNLTAIDGRHVNYPDRVFTDPVHLDRDGATAYSLGIAEVLRDRLDRRERPAADRFVALPDKIDRAGEVPLEDYEQTAAAIRAEGGKVVR